MLDAQTWPPQWPRVNPAAARAYIVVGVLLLLVGLALSAFALASAGGPFELGIIAGPITIAVGLVLLFAARARGKLRV